MTARDRSPWIVLLLLLAVQALLVACEPPSRFWGDEPYYVEKARFLYQHGSLQKATPRMLAVEAGAWGNSDWRPQGYTVLLTALCGGHFDPESLRPRVATLQFLAMAAAILAAFHMLRGKSFRIRLLAAIAMGLAPWPFAFVSTVGPDSLNASVTFFGVWLLARWAASPTERWPLPAGALLLSLTLLLRPEMIAVVPVPIGVALLVRHLSHRTTLRDWSIAAAAFLLVVTVQYGYRSYFIGRFGPSLFGGLHIYNPGLFEWANSWIGTEDEAYDFVYAMNIGDRPVALPERAFASPREKEIVESLRAEARAHGFSQAIDQRFGALAKQRKHEHFFTAAVLPRLWHAVHLWLNTETTDQLLQAWKPVPRPIRRGLLALLLLFKAALVSTFAILVLLRWRLVVTTPAIAVLTSLVVARTVLVGIVLNWMVYRYMVPGWIPLITGLFLLAAWPAVAQRSRE